MGNAISLSHIFFSITLSTYASIYWFVYFGLGSRLNRLDVVSLSITSLTQVHYSTVAPRGYSPACVVVNQCGSPKDGNEMMERFPQTPRGLGFFNGRGYENFEDGYINNTNRSKTSQASTTSHREMQCYGSTTLLGIRIY